MPFLLNQFLLTLLFQGAWEVPLLTEATEGANHSAVLQFVFLGLFTSGDIQIFLSLFSCVFYVVSPVGNLLIVLSVTSVPGLQSPTYFLLANRHDILPLHSSQDDLWCFKIMQNHLFWGLCSSDLLYPCSWGHWDGVLITMASDRYVAILSLCTAWPSWPPWRCILFLVTSWIIGLIHSVTQRGFVVDLPFCGPNALDSFFCDLPRFIKLACGETNTLGFMVTANSGFISVAFCLLLIISYIFVLVTVQKIFRQYVQGSLHSVSSCTVVVLFFGPLILFYVWPFPTSHLKKFLAIFDAVITILFWIRLPILLGIKIWRWQWGVYALSL